MIRNIYIILFILILALSTLNSSSYVFAYNGGPLKYKIKLKDGVDESFIKDMNEVLETTSVKTDQARTYVVRVNESPKMKELYFVLFNNLPSIASVDGKQAKPISLYGDAGKTQDSPAAAMPQGAKNDSAGSSYKSGEPEYYPGEVLLKLEEDTPAGLIDKVNRVFGTRVIDFLIGIDVYQLEIPEGRCTRTYVDIMSVIPQVRYTELNLKVHVF